MVSIKPISKAVLIDYIRIAFEGDKELGKYHILGIGDLDECSADTFKRCLITSERYKLRFFKVVYNKVSIGFFVVGETFLYSFGIAPKYRKKEILNKWFSFVKKVLPKHFFSVMNEVNTRAISFLEKQGMEVHNRDEGTKTVTLLIK